VVVALTASVIGLDHAATHLVARAAAVMLFVMAILSSLTGARTSVLPMKLCPVVKLIVGAAYIAATIV